MHKNYSFICMSMYLKFLSPSSKQKLSLHIFVCTTSKEYIVKAMVFPVVMYGCESWTIKKTKHGCFDPFDLWCWRRLLRVPWTAKRSNQSILMEITPEYSLEGLMLNLKLQYIGHLMWWANPLEKTLILGRLKAGEQGRTEDEMVGWHHQLNGFEFEQTLEDNEGQRRLACCGPQSCKESDMN